MNLKKMSLVKLDGLAAQIADERARREAEKNKLRRDMEGLAKKRGLNLDEVLSQIGAKTTTKRRGRAKGAKPSAVVHEAKYRNPANPDQTWSGRGRPPKWVVEHDALHPGKRDALLV